MPRESGLIQNARLIAEGRHRHIERFALLLLCQAFGGRDWIGRFDYPAGDPRGAHERVVALCMAEAILEC